jgi:FSR family fosmidomycin resistance protein-like MFS transporter
MSKQVTEQPQSLTLKGKNSISGKTVYPILIAISISHLLNDALQSIIPAIYPVVKESFSLTFAQVGLITLTFQLSASLLQPFVGLYTDRKPQPYSLAIGMGFTLVGLIFLSRAPSFEILILSVAMVGIGSSIFHPEASRLAHLASGGRRGMAQSIFQLGGNFGSSIGPLLAALIIVPYGQSNIIWFSALALLAIILLINIGGWYKRKIRIKAKRPGIELAHTQLLSKNTVFFSVLILLVLIFSKYIYLTSMTTYYTFYVIHKFGVSVQDSQVYLFVFLFSIAAGTIIGGPLGDKFGRKYVIWGSILGVAPFSLLLPHANLMWTVILTIPIGVILASAFSAILVYAHELFPGKVGMVSGLFFGFAFGMAGVGSAVLGGIADQTSIEYVYEICAFLPLIGLITVFLPNIKTQD